MKSSLCSLFLFAGLTLSACNSTSQLPADPVPESDQTQRIVFADDLRGEIAYEPAVAIRDEQNLLELRLPIRNIAGKDLRLMLQVQFVDEYGAPSGDETNRQYFMLPHNSTQTFRTVSRTSSARDYRLFIWRAEK